MNGRLAGAGCKAFPALTLLVTVALWAGSGPAHADPDCMAHVLADVAAQEAPEQIKSKKTDDFGPITRIKVSKKTGQMYFCSGTSYCYGSNAFKMMTPCRIKLNKDTDSDDFFEYTGR